MCGTSGGSSRSYLPSVLFTLLLVGVVYSHSVSIEAHNRNSNIRSWDRGTKSATDKLLCYFSLPDSEYNTTLPDGLNATLCTHVIFIPSVITSCEITAKEPFHLNLFDKVIPVIKKQNRNLKVLLSNGGGNDKSFVPVMESKSNMSRYVNSIVPFLRKYRFDGLDLDWEFPGWNGLPVTERHNFSVITIMLRNLFEMEAAQTKKERLLLSAAVAAGKDLMVIYEYDILAKSLDYVNMMGYDYNSFNDLHPFVSFNSPLHPEVYDKTFFKSNNLAWSATQWVSRGIPREKLMVGIPTYVHTYKLLFEGFTKPGSPAIDKGNCDECGYAWACQNLQNNWTKVYDDYARVPYMYQEKQWVSYDDVQSITEKTQWIKDHGFGGVMVYSMKLDDKDGVCDGVTKFPLIAAVRKVLFGS